MAERAAEMLRFEPLQSAADTGFWAALGQKKLDDWRLSEEPREIIGFASPSTHDDVAAPLYLDARSLGTAPAPPAGAAAVPGALHVVNSLDKFKAFDRGAALAAAAATAWADVRSGAALADPARLARFVLLAHADLKTYRFTYWFAFPALKPPAPFGVVGPAAPLERALGVACSVAVAAACDTHREASPGVPAWVVALDGDAARVVPLNELGRLIAGPAGTGDGAGDIGTAGTAATTATASPPPNLLLAFNDPAADAAHPGWPLRNLLLLVAARWGLRAVRVLCVRLRGGRVAPGACLVLDATLPALPPGWPGEGAVPEAVGWEANARGRPGARAASLGAAMEPTRLAADALDLNLRLMRWRAAPHLEPAVIGAARYLLLGAGTLGCGAARALLGWGARSITLLDCGRVAFSNPPRQPLYEFTDCLDGGKPKAAAAAAALRRVFPGCAAEGVELAIPMPGHPPADAAEAEAAAAAVQALDALVRKADVIMLLTDTRESRWLPTLLAAAHGTLAITAALGFDSYVVMRHGVAAADMGGTGDGQGQATIAGTGDAVGDAAGDAAGDAGRRGVGSAPRHPAPAAPSPRLGCYFCNDVVAPGDSTVDRALDQQCTVARPGLAPLASALAVELAATVLAHPERAAAPAPPDDPAAEDGDALPLGPAPHMLRGRLGAGFAQTAMVGRAFGRCTACSPAVVAAYRTCGADFVLDALRDPGALEQVTGLAQLHAATDELLARGVGGEGEGGSSGKAGGSGSASCDGDDGDDWTEL